MTTGWEQFGGTGLMLIALMYAGVGIALLETVFNKAHLSIPAGIVSAFVVVLTPSDLRSRTVKFGHDGLDPSVSQLPHAYRLALDHHESSTLVVGVLMLWRYQLPFSVMPIAVTLWYMSMDLTPFDYLAMKTIHGKCGRLSSPFCFGAGMLVFAFLVDLRHHFGNQGTARFWDSIYSASSHSGADSLMDSSGEFGEVSLFCINLAMIAVGAMSIAPRLLFWWGFGAAGYVGHLASGV